MAQILQSSCMSNYNLKLEAPWEQTKEMIKEVKPELTDEDLNYEQGKEQELLEHLSKKTGMPADEVRGWIESVSANSGKAS